jgi:hypothetical protein
MTTDVTIRNGQQPLTMADLSAERAAVLRTWVAPSLTDAEREAFLAYCAAIAADPFGRELYAWKDKKNNTIAIHPAIDFLRRRAGESGEYEGQIGPEYTDDGEKWLSVWLKKTAPAAVRVGILRRGFRAPLWGISVRDRDKRDIPGPWQTNTTGMMEVTAERRCLKRAFPRELESITRDLGAAASAHGFAVSDYDSFVDETTGEIVEDAAVTAVEAQDAAIAPEPVVVATDWKDEAKRVAAKVKKWAGEHQTDPTRLRYYMATAQGVPDAVTWPAFHAWLEEVGPDFDALYTLYVDGERNATAEAAAQAPLMDGDA